MVAWLILTVAGSRLSFTVAAAVSFAIQGVGLRLLPVVGLSIPLTLLCVAAVERRGSCHSLQDAKVNVLLDGPPGSSRRRFPRLATRCAILQPRWVCTSVSW